MQQGAISELMHIHKGNRLLKHEQAFGPKSLKGGSIMCRFCQAGLKVILWKNATGNTGASDGTEL